MVLLKSGMKGAHLIMKSQNQKHSLHFREDGTFRVVMMSDLQESSKYDPRSLRSVEVLLEECKPDLVVLGGDNCYGPEIKSEQELIAFLDIFTVKNISMGSHFATKLLIK